jgi:hypothetical protein
MYIKGQFAMKNTNYLQTNMENVQGIFSTLQNTVINIPEIFTSTRHEPYIKDCLYCFTLSV